MRARADEAAHVNWSRVQKRDRGGVGGGGRGVRTTRLQETEVGEVTPLYYKKKYCQHTNESILIQATIVNSYFLNH